MEGSYSKVWNAREEAPAEEYKFFVDSLMGTIRYVSLSSRFSMLLAAFAKVADFCCEMYRNEIASCEEAAYESLPLKDAATLLFFKTQTELMNFAQQVRYSPCDLLLSGLPLLTIVEQRGWQVNLTAGTISFSHKGEEKIEIPKEKLIANNLAYARELEQIV